MLILKLFKLTYILKKLWCFQNIYRKIVTKQLIICIFNFVRINKYNAFYAY